MPTVSKPRDGVGIDPDAVDTSTEGRATMTGGETLADFIDEPSLASETQKAAARNRAVSRPFRQYQKKVIELAGLKNSQLIRQLSSNICGSIARLPDVPDNEEEIDDIRGNKTTEFEQQVARSAEVAEAQMGVEVVLTVSARKLARAALELRQKDPDGTKGIAWVNDPLTESDGGALDV